MTIIEPIANSTEPTPTVNTSITINATALANSIQPHSSTTKAGIAPQLIAIPSKVLTLNEFVKDLALLASFVMLSLTGMAHISSLDAIFDRN